MINKILKADRRGARYGAPLGYPNKVEDLKKLRLQKVALKEGYAPDGTYWGMGGPPLYCAFNLELVATRLYVRANNREEAKALILEDYYDATFKCQ